MPSRFHFILRRLLHAVPLVLGITLLVFLLLDITPGDPARTVAGLRASPEAVEIVRERLGLHENVVVRYGRYLGGLVRGDLGRSNRGGTEVTAIIGDRLPVTLWLLAAAALLSVAISVPAATLAARARNRLPDHGVRLMSLVALNMASFWVGYMLLRFVALPSGWFPVGGFGGSTLERLRAIFLPAATLAVGMAPILTRSLRSSMIDVLESDYVSAARSVGVRGGRLVRRHVLRNALIPTSTLLASQLGYLLFGAVVVEFAFDLPGLGDAMVTATSRRDFSVVQGITLVFALTVVGINLLADVVHTVLDPRVTIR